MSLTGLAVDRCVFTFPPLIPAFLERDDGRGHATRVVESRAKSEIRHSLLGLLTVGNSLGEN